jgi:hypothetical protein
MQTMDPVTFGPERVVEQRRFRYADTGRLRADAALSGLISTIPLVITLDAASLTGLPRIDLAARFAAVVAGTSQVGLFASATGWFGVASLSVLSAIVYAQTLARRGSAGMGAPSGALHGVFMGAIASIVLGLNSGLTGREVMAFALASGVCGASAGALLRLMTVYAVGATSPRS